VELIKNDTIMNLQHKLDCAIRDKEGKQPYGEGYIISKSKLAYDRYMSNEGWERYLAEMSDNHRKQYEEGDGGEIIEKRGRWGTYPPKMACYGSSSRIIYTYLREVGGIKFEHQLPTRVGSRPANLDAYLYTDRRDIFVEAKCREIYAKLGNVKASTRYNEVYEYINKSYNSFSFGADIISDNQGVKDKNNYNYRFFYNNEPIIRFDIKQLISHFLGIAAGVLEGVIKDNIRFVYFIYNPKELGNEALEEVYDNTKKEIDKIKIKDLFKAVFEYQKKNLKIEKEMPIFEFVLADQNDIIDKLK
jgi:hypothetical protein